VALHLFRLMLKSGFNYPIFVRTIWGVGASRGLVILVTSMHFLALASSTEPQETYGWRETARRPL
jgi:hypothetical protein